MPVIVNGVELSDADLERELPLHADAGNPMRHAITALVLRRVLLDEALRLGVGSVGNEDADNNGANDSAIGDNEDAIITALLARQAAAPLADDAACRRFYHAHPQRFMVGELVEADHILFQVTPDVNLDMLRAHANVVLQDLLADPSSFAQVAREQSNCPSAAVGGSLGQLGRGDTVPEFERAVFALPSGGLLPQLLQTRHGLHIVRVTRRIEGRMLPYEHVAQQIAASLSAMSQDTAWRQYTKLLVDQADVQGIDLQGSEADRVVGGRAA
ncbi:peptidylprolyl isomerase [Achromobacter spanius]|uniref:peptidylprolyl isomerase n=1 Tax=Achromobacter spanius TaxID=217203 RepID=A0A2S5GKU4_9BURK|nr:MULTISPECIES: peptidylprolyl isomerase [Achromobacter]AYD67660.1 peptidylprolyl isomerase [Achromobacter sp. B7]PPA73619.1 peptidylprolyl isomerase [Achromobacter spanius]